MKQITPVKLTNLTIFSDLQSGLRATNNHRVASQRTMADFHVSANAMVITAHWIRHFLQCLALHQLVQKVKLVADATIRFCVPKFAQDPLCKLHVCEASNGRYRYLLLGLIPPPIINGCCLIGPWAIYAKSLCSLSSTTMIIIRWVNLLFWPYDSDDEQ
jgi:hypothetical protein